MKMPKWWPWVSRETMVEWVRREQGLLLVMENHWERLLERKEEQNMALLAELNELHMQMAAPARKALGAPLTEHLRETCRNQPMTDDEWDAHVAEYERAERYTPEDAVAGRDWLLRILLRVMEEEKDSGKM